MKWGRDGRTEVGEVGRYWKEERSFGAPAARAPLSPFFLILRQGKKIPLTALYVSHIMQDKISYYRPRFPAEQKSFLLANS